MRLAGTKLAANHQYRGFGDQLYDLSGQRPSLDLQFANQKSLVDATTGQNLVTFTRASSGTYVDSQGVIQRATTNLLLRSEEFDNASWTKGSSVSVSANTVIAPNGTLTADTVTADSGFGVFQTITSVIGVNYSNSIYVKAGTAASMMFRDDTGAGRHIIFNPLTGVITSTAGTLVSSGSQAVGDGWYRYWMVYVTDATSVRGIIRPNSAGSAQTFAVWGAQLEQSSTVGEYIPTTSTINSAPRFDHNPTTGESLGLLVEEQRTNLLLRSEEFDNASWNKLATTVSANVEPSPFGLNTADKLTEDASTTTHVVQQAPTVISGATYTFSCYLKAAERTFALVARDSAIALGVNLITGQIVGTTGSPIQATSQSVGNGWWRVVLTFTTSSTTHNMNIYTSQDGVFANRSYAGTLGSGIFLWGAQLEAGSFPTSYIPTTTATVTRSADVASISGSNFSSWYRQDEGTVFAEAISPATSTTVFAISDGSTNNRIQIETGSNTRRFRITSSGTSRYDNSVSYTLGTSGKSVGAYIVSGSNHATNGVLGVDLAGSPLPVVDRLLIGTNGAGLFYNNGTIRRLTYWPTRLPNETLQGITQ